MNRRLIPHVLAVSLILLAGSATLRSAEPRPTDPAGVDFFEKRVRPVLSQQCYKCHSSSAQKLKGNLLLDSRSSAIQGGDSGPAIVPGDPDKSLLIEAVRYQNQDMKMPPRTPLPPNVVADLAQWVKMGAPWPAEGGVASATTRPAGGGSLASYDRLRREHWAWQPLSDPAVPAGKNTSWPAGNIDRFLLARLEAKGLAPVADADQAALIRRVTFDLIGLPPTPDEVASFLADPSPDAFARRVDQLLASKSFGERWGRHWLDLARYAESTGSSRNVPFGAAWRYRNYVIDSFNQDKPYDRFITEQIAGDLLPAHDAVQRDQQMIATGFLALGIKDLNERDRVKYQMDNVDEQIDVTTRSILGLTVACARCHDHKFDPIPTADYYAMAGIFRSTTILAGVQGRTKGGANMKAYSAPAQLIRLTANAPAAPEPKPGLTAEQTDRIASLQTRLEAVQQELTRLRKAGKKENQAQRQAKRQEIAALDAEIEAIRDGGALSAGSAAMGVVDSPTPADCAICLHGEPHELGDVVPRGFISVLPIHSLPPVNASQSGRLEMAQWMTGAENPLTPRVMVNRIWQHLFGEGLVRTVDNFGATGDQPINPELLDYLARDFTAHGWSIKHAIRQIVLSRAYRLSTHLDPVDFKADPGDRLTWRMNPRRLDAEEIRDAMLVAGGDLNASPMAGSLVSSLPVSEIRAARLGSLASEDDHRSVYLPILRELVPPVLDLFDFAEPTMVIGSRDATTVPTQALFLLNDPFVTGQAHRLATRLQNATGVDDAGRVDLAYRITLSRSASASEKARVLRYLSDYQRESVMSSSLPLHSSRSEAWASFCQALLAGAEFRYLN